MDLLSRHTEVGVLLMQVVTERSLLTWTHITLLFCAALSPQAIAIALWANICKLP